MERSLLIWGLVLIVGVPLLTVLLGEGIERLERQRNPLVPFLRRARTYLLPTVALLLVLKTIVSVSEEVAIVRLLETGVWIAASMTILALLSSLFTPGEKARRWQISLPNLFFQFVRALAILIIAGYVMATIWGVDLSNVATALGVGSLVIALALQDTLSNLVSGFLLLFSKPFKIGDWIQIGDIEAEVIGQDWRAVRLQTITGYLITVPNGVLSQETIYNFTLLNPWTWREFFVRFSYNDPPNRVKQILHRAMLDTPGVLAEPKPLVFVESYEDFYITYYMGYALKSFADSYDLTDEIKSRIYYAAKRHRLTIPYPTQMEYRQEGHPRPAEVSASEISQFFRSLAYFSALHAETIESLAQTAIVEYYGQGDRVVQMGVPDEYFYLILAGTVQLTVLDLRDRNQDVAQLQRGDCFGEMAFLPGEPSPVSGLVLEDLNVVALDRNAVTRLIEASPKFALEINNFIEERKRAVQIAKGVTPQTRPATPTNGEVPSSH
ncbi:MAG: mechanosensitive ion channel [Spirulina sp. SIO3F2]|nr:mechanosensitive ion channel [Spirulina sp. SIO3F2]